MIENIFLAIIGMSITASIAAVMIILFGLLVGRRLPKNFSYAAGAIVLIRLLIPFSIATSFSLFNFIPSHNSEIDQEINTANYEGKGITQDATISESFGNLINSSAEGTDFYNIIDNTQSQNGTVILNDNTEGRSVITVLSGIWLFVFLILLGFCINAYLKTSGRLKTAILFNDNGLLEVCSRKLNLNRKINIFISDTVDTPVVAGFARVRIILPVSLVHNCSSRDLEYVITHELVHIKRHDNITKLLAVLALCIHWFNPLVWLGYYLSQNDMEMSCDARVLSAHKNDIRSEYAKSLLNIAARQNILLHGGLLAFGESNIRSRIKGIMKFTKNRVWQGIAAALLLVVFGCILLTNGQSDDTGKSKPTVTDDKTPGNLLEHRTRYIGDAVNVSNLLDKLPYGENKEGIELATDSKPYGITINYRLEDIEASSEDTIKSEKPVLQDNALILFSLIENVDTVKFSILPVNVEVQFERSEMQQYFDRQLWEYSSSEEYFEEFLLDVYFKIYIFPEKYSMSMSSVPGMRIVVSLNAALYDATCSKKCSTENGSLLTWDRNTGKITDRGKSLYSTLGEPVYWSPLDIEEDTRDDAVTISVLNEDGDIVIEKHISIEKEDDHSYSTKPSYDIITGSYHDFMQDGDAVNENAINKDNEYNELTEHAVSMEELLDNSDFQYMTEEQMGAILKTFPEIIRDNYQRIGRIENNSGYMLLTCKSGAKPLPEDTICCMFSPADSELEQLVLQDADENEICRFPLGLEVSYYKGNDIFYIAVGDASKNTSRISQIARYQLSGNRDFIEYAKQAKMRGTSLFIPQAGSYISADIWINRSHLKEYMSIDESFTSEIESRLGNIEKTHYDFSSRVLKRIGIVIALADRNNYELCLLDDGTKVIHKWDDRNAVLVDPEIHDMIADFVMEKTSWEWVELSEIYDIVKAEMCMKLNRDSREEVQIIEDRDTLMELEELLSNAKYTGCGGCPYTALLLLTREDGATITLHIATDSCDSMILGTTAGYDYGPDPGQVGLGGDVNRQEVLIRIFDRINWER